MSLLSPRAESHRLKLHFLSEGFGLKAACEPKVKVSVGDSGLGAMCEPKIEISMAEEAS